MKRKQIAAQQNQKPLFRTIRGNPEKQRNVCGEVRVWKPGKKVGWGRVRTRKARRRWGEGGRTSSCGATVKTENNSSKRNRLAGNRRLQ